VTIYAPGIKLNEIRGRGIVLHEREDDNGKAGTDESRTTGSAGARIACGTIT
jgi:Cu-Zn family superoxide dismutase